MKLKIVSGLMALLIGAAVTNPDQIWFTANGTGAGQRKLKLKLGEIVSVTDYQSGHTCDTTGATDSAPCIQAASDAQSAGTTLVFPPGTYLINSAITVKSGVTYFGNGAIIQATSGALLADGMLKCTSCTGTRFVGLELNGNTNAGATVGGKYGIKLASGSRNTVSGVYIHDTYQACVYGDSEDSFHVDGGRYITCGRNTGTDNHGIMVGSSTASNMTSTRIVGAYVSGAYRKGIALFNTSTGINTDALIAGNVVIGSGLGNIYVSGFTLNQGISVTGNTTSSGGSVDIQFSSVNGGSVSGNTSRSSGGIGILLDSCIECSATSNTVDLAQSDGISVSSVTFNSKNVAVVGNAVTHSNQSAGANKAGIHLNATTYSRVEGNIITDHSGTPLQKYCLLEDGASDSNSYLGNTCFGTATASSSFGGTNVSNDTVSTSQAVLSSTANPASAGAVRLAAGDTLAWRNAANSGDVTITKNASDNITLTNGGIVAPQFFSSTASQATAGQVRLATTDGIDWRNNANSANLALAHNTTDQLTWGGTGFLLTAVAFASLGTPGNGSLVYCSDCTIANPCASGGTGGLAKRLNGVWICN